MLFMMRFIMTVHDFTFQSTLCEEQADSSRESRDYHSAHAAKFRARGGMDPLFAGARRDQMSTRSVVRGGLGGPLPQVALVHEGTMFKELAAKHDSPVPIGTPRAHGWPHVRRR